MNVIELSNYIFKELRYCIGLSQVIRNNRVNFSSALSLFTIIQSTVRTNSQKKFRYSKGYRIVNLNNFKQTECCLGGRNLHVKTFSTV